MTVVLAGLIALLCWQQWFWMRHTQKLVDKLMSRDYTEYKYSSNPPAITPRSPEPQQPDEDLGILEQIGLR